MNKSLNFTLSPEIGLSNEKLDEFLRDKLGTEFSDHFTISKRSIDARSNKVRVRVFLESLVNTSWSYQIPRVDVSQSDEIVIVGAGPAGLFAALKVIELGFRPVVLERGKDVRSRRRDIAAINKDHTVNPESNYCFGEGGAGTYSDGKLYTRSKKRGSVKRVLEILVAHGAKKSILYDAHPHIGTNKLPKIIQSIRETIIDCGGTVVFNAKVTNLHMKDNDVHGVELSTGEILKGRGTILATGHSARDIFYMLDQSEVTLEVKSFALGVRIEHQQEFIDRIQYHCQGSRGPYLPAAPYSLVTQTIYNKVNRGVFSFCMCPGGFIVPSATSQEEVVVNGMSPSRRDSRFANSGIVVSVEPEDLIQNGWKGTFACLEFQKHIEKRNFEMANRGQSAIAQRTQDFVDGKVSTSLLETSYQPGLISGDINELIPGFISNRLQQAFKAFDHKMKGFCSNESQIVAVESRTSSPVRIPRDKETCEHIEVKRLFPCGEGAGYAGGIVSAAIDGERCAENLVRLYGQK